MTSATAVVIFWAALVCWVGSSHGQAQYLRNKINPSDIPRSTSGKPIVVTVGFTLTNILMVDLASNEVELVLWSMYRWKVDDLKWNPEQFKNVSAIRMPINDVWKPDVTPYSSTRASEPLSPERVVITSDGSVLYVPAERVRVMCDVRAFQSDQGAECSVKFGSWTYSGFDIDLQVDTESVDLSSYFDGSKFEVLSATQTREVSYYPCCPEPYPDVRLRLTFREKREKGFFSGLFD